MDEVFNKICKECNGTCCKTFEIFLTKEELDNIKNIKPLIFKKEGSAFLMCHKERCIFLGEKGCILNPEQKPTDCTIAPLVFTYINKKIEFYLLKDCKFIHEIPEYEIEKLKKITLERIKDWSEEDKITYSKMLEEYPDSELVKL
ncbi:MAG: YkgJ family cysteine cluster protein [Candidatus Nanoarchaeia archaeon]|nr:YkgJ family cysteine cluster protein [Candidatus Nanoarchaeia archaeon]